MALPQVGARAQQALSVVLAQVLGGAVQQEVVGQQVVVKGWVKGCGLLRAVRVRRRVFAQMLIGDFLFV